MDQPARKRSWDSALRRLVWRVNVGWWLQAWAGLSLAVCLAGAVVVLGVRTLWPAWVVWLPWALAGAFLLTLLAAWLRARRSFESPETARVRLEDALGLHSALSAAAQGAVPWPAVPAVVQLPVRWRAGRALGMVALSVGVLLAALWVPVSTGAKAEARLIEKPAAVSEVEQWVERLRETEAVDSESLGEVEKRVAELVHRPQEQWYEHASLEAAEHLRNETGKALQELGAQMERGRGSLAALAEAGLKAGDEAKTAAAKEAGQMLEGLRSGAMKAGSELAEQLRNLDAEALQGMSREQLKRMAERLKQNADALREALANAPQFDFKECARCLSQEGEGEGQGRDGPGRGGKEAALTVKRDETRLGTERSEDLAGMLDAERMAPGDLVGTSDERHGVDESAFAGPVQGGAAGVGGGGAVVMQSELLPSERETLKRYFK